MTDNQRTGPGVPIRVDHVALAVHDVGDAEPLLELLGAEKLTEQPSHDGSFTWAYYDLGDASRIELVTPREGESFVTSFLETEGPGLHHVTLEVADIDAVVDHLERGGVRVVDRAAHEEYSEAFVSPRETGALFQLMEYHDAYDEDLMVGGEPVGESE